MRWDALFEDLEAQFGAMQDSEFLTEVADRTRAELGRITMLDRLRAAVGATVSVDIGTGQDVMGKLSRVGKDCLLIDTAPHDEWLIPVGAISGLSGLGPWAQMGAGVAARLGMAHLLRGIARDRSPVTVLCGEAETPATGTIDRVGADFVELARHPLDAPRRRTEVYDVRLIPTAAMRAVRRR
jgi:hypothetical protein